MSHFQHWHYHFWRSPKRQSYNPLNIFTWFVTLPISIGADIIIMPYSEQIRIDYEKRK
jgi:hypothetical protein